jgi:methylamine dehydrogenase heavy chain
LAPAARIAYDRQAFAADREPMMRTSQVRAALLALLVNGAAYAAEPLAAEQFTVQQLPAPTPHWVYIVDEAFYNEIDARVRLFDGDSYRHLGQIDAGFTPGVIQSPDGRTTAVATTYYGRGGHGARTDVVEFTDNSTLGIAGEIVLPPKRVQIMPTYFNVAYSSDSRFMYVAYVTPAASFGVLDPAQKKVLSEIDTAGCVLVIPSGPDRVSSLCDNGRLLTVTLDDHGQEATRSLSEPLFDPEQDPLFVQGVPDSSGYTFLSFLGQVHPVDFSGPQPAFLPAWSLVSAAERGRWRPGGVQIAAIHRKLGRLYVSMHRGGEGSHKQAGSEIWVFDLKTHQRLARWPLAKSPAGEALALQVSQDDAPVLFTASEHGTVAVFDALTGQLRHVDRNLGQSPWFFLNP